jgi:hypothetical protein
MSSVVISGDTSGAITVSAPLVAGTNTLTLQAATATNSVNVLGTAVASTSGTSIDFTGLPSWVKKITVMLSGVSVSSTSSILVQLGTGATPTYTITGYAGGGVRFGTSTLGAASFTTGFGLNNASAAALIGGSITITNVTGNTWSASGTAGSADTGTFVMVTGGSIALAAALTAVRITTNGADTFDAGSVNILYEG